MPPLSEMPLYGTIGRIRNELREIGDPSSLTPEQLFRFDQIHYRGTDAVRDAALALRLGPANHVLELGAGIGGPARFLAHTTGCRVTALELQREMHAIGEDLTARCGLSDRVTHALGDALTYEPVAERFDAVVSWLAVHHIPDRRRLLRRIAASLHPGGRLYIEDLCERVPFTLEDQVVVERMLHGVTMTTADDYVRDIGEAGFGELEATDMTSAWTAFCGARAVSWRAAVDRHRRVHGDAIFSALDAFFTTVHQMFASGRLGGVRVLASRV